MPSNQLIVPQTYAALRDSVQAVLVTGQREIEQAKVRTYHDTGWLIREHLRLHENESNYGTKTMLQLAKDLKTSDSVLYRCVRFVECFPILARGPKLSWAHYRLLIPIENPMVRRELEAEAVKGGWIAAELDAHIRPLRAEEASLVANGDNSAVPAAKLLTPKRGTPGLHPIIDAVEGLAVDLGFKLYWPLTTEQAKRYEKGAIVRIGEDDSIRAASDATKADLYTYTAKLVRVIDGDTLVVALEVSPGVFMEQKLRLRGLDCPEMSTPEGRAAKRFVDALVAKTTGIVINTSRVDKYDRYLADVFLEGDFSDSPPAISQLLAASKPREDGSSPLSQAADGSLFLNNALLANGQAVRKEAWQFTDWEPHLLN